MALSVNTNITSLTVQRNLNKAGDALGTSMTRLSSGLKINSAKDDAAGMQIANRLTSQVKGMTVAIANANNGTSIAQTAEGAMQESTNILQRLRELALQSANGDKSDADRASLQQEFTAKSGELTRIAQTTTFGGRQLLDGSFQNVGFQIGADANQTISFGMSDLSAAGLKGTYSEATVKGATTSLSASVTAKAVELPGAKPAISTTTPFVQTGANYVAPTAGNPQTFQINGQDVTVAAGADIDTALAAIQGAGITGVTAAKAGTTLTLTSSSAISITGTNTVFGAATASGGVTSVTTPAVTGKLDAAASININGSNVKFAVGDDLAAIAGKINTANGTDKFGVTASVSAEGRLELASADGKAIKLGNGTGPATEGGAGALAKLGLSAGTTEAKLGAATSVSLNGTEVKFTAGSTMADIVSSINSASTGVTASKNADNTLNLFSTKDITVADGSAGTGLATLGLTAAAAAPTTATKMDTTVADLSILSSTSAQQTIQALEGAIQQVDSQRSQLGAVQNRFDSTVANLQSISENSTAARSRVQDADFASEAAELTKQQTLQQASTAILSQANQLPSAVLKLLQ
ncbi:flagellin [Pseudomonas sp. WS 5059]|uniref:flagellin N-terminal helical domain-containing protein n=1 Tax=Pseudomonas sp. WS 5059 TaxID=2717491 RepID=UPI0014759F06|nr:flagellin [Pseudomonas sp. WS 5059]NMY04377.1 flagellin [Pseudomonas sp. WS 5059]